MSLTCHVCNHVLDEPMVERGCTNNWVYHKKCTSNSVTPLRLTCKDGCSLCCDSSHASIECIQTIVSEFRRTVMQTTNGVQLDNFISKLYFEQLCHIKHPRLQKNIKLKITECVECDPTLFIENNTVFASHVHIMRAIDIPRDGNWHDIQISNTVYSWLASAGNCKFSVRRNMGIIAARHKTRYNLDTPLALDALLKGEYPRGIQELDLYAEHEDMGRWLKSNPRYVFLESDKGGNIVYLPDLHGISASIAQSYGTTCGMVFELLYGQKRLDFDIFPQIHATPRHALIKDLIVAGIITCEPGYIYGASMMLSVNKQTVARMYPAQILEYDAEVAHVSESNIDLRRRTRHRTRRFCRPFARK